MQPIPADVAPLSVLHPPWRLSVVETEPVDGLDEQMLEPLKTC